MFLLSLTSTIIHIKKDGLRVVKAWIIVPSLLWHVVILLLQLFVQVFYQFYFHFLVYTLERDSFIKCIFELLGLIFDINILVLDLPLNTFHVRLDVVNVLDSLMCILVSDVTKDSENLHILLLQIFNHIEQLLIFSSKFQEIA